ncbi:MAG: hypothetical protein HY903_01805 [Deltaproteobacteria bacterium]|nr:hypothetical protein [Deltaproteobacteria bacterium]
MDKTFQRASRPVSPRPRLVAALGRSRLRGAVALGVAVGCAVLASTGSSAHGLFGVRRPRSAEWLGELALASVHRLAGDSGLSALAALAAGLALVIAAATLRPPWVSRLWLMLGSLLLSLDHTYLRPQLFAWPLAALSCWALQRKHYWLVPPVFLVWGNVHASVAVAAVVGGLHFADEYRRRGEWRALAQGALCLLLPLINPTFVRVYTAALTPATLSTALGEATGRGSGNDFVGVFVTIVILAALGVLTAHPRNPFDLAAVAGLTVVGLSVDGLDLVAVVYLAPLVASHYEARAFMLASRLRAGLTAAAVAGFVVVALWQR